ncbi:DUF3501 family protein [Caenorhabditis elegans]|nr:DUF3501 family protein [Caenorhabditis elegans]CBM41188.1 DUF3501 family protein [Caenorhabditis elegans]|eukprot:NP_001256202.1 Uncharacterized protein CELE_C12D8.9 [Caenorhabditis elegans]
MHRASQIRIKQRYNCAEQEVTQMRAPFLGFSVFVRFQSRARAHTIKIINEDEVEQMLASSPVPYS